MIIGGYVELFVLVIGFFIGGGSGMFCYFSSLCIYNCWFVVNGVLDVDVSGVFCGFLLVLIELCEIVENFGGGFWVGGLNFDFFLGIVELWDCVICDNVCLFGVGFNIVECVNVYDCVI